MSGRPALVLLLRAFLVALASAPFLPAAASAAGLEGVSRVADAWFAFHCERDSARTLSGVAVCVRCHGIYSGLALGALAARPRLRSPWHELWIAAGALLMLFDVASESAGLRPAWAPLRFATGVLLAYPVGVLVVLAVARGTNGPTTDGISSA